MSTFRERHTPKKINDLVFTDTRTKKRLEEFASNQRHENLLLHGPFGTGKSTAAKIIADQRMRKIGNGRAEILHASEITGDRVDKIRERWQNTSNPIFGVEHPLTIIGEIDQVDQKLQQKLRSVHDDETAPGSFILTTNHLHKVDSGLKDRCDEVELAGVDIDRWFERSKAVLIAEGVNISDADLRSVLSTCDGSIRDLMRLLEDTVLRHRQLRSHLKLVHS